MFKEINSWIVKIFTNPFTIFGFIFLLLIIILQPYINPFIPTGEITGIFIEGSHEGFGDYCGQYPNSRIRLRNATYNQEHFWGENNQWFHFGNQYTGIDKMVVGEKYKIWYHQSSRPSDTTSGDEIKYFVINNMEEV